MTALQTILIIVGAIVLWVAFSYNGFVRRRNRAQEAWADIDVQLKRRYELIPNLVETVKGYAEHEREAFREVTEARARALGAQSVSDQQQAENQITDALKSIFAIAENYPDLKASENFKELQRELSDTENKIQAARRFYNTNVRDLNTRIESFPHNIVAGMFGIQKREFFELDNESAREPISVEF